MSLEVKFAHACAMSKCISTAQSHKVCVTILGSGIFPANFRTCKFQHKVALFKCPSAFRRRKLAQSLHRASGPGNVSCTFPYHVAQVHFDCAGSHKVCIALLGPGLFPVPFRITWVPVLGSFLLHIILLNIIIV